MTCKFCCGKISVVVYSSSTPVSALITRTLFVFYVCGISFSSPAEEEEEEEEEEGVSCKCNSHANVCHVNTGKCFCTTKGIKGDQCQLCDSENRYLATRGRLIRDGHQVPRHFCWRDRQPVELSASHQSGCSRRSLLPPGLLGKLSQAKGEQLRSLLTASQSQLKDN
ncbi:unnamed protein product [Pleuronectes platessa]|uniref:Laminin EGF-like domain-containing protein n=1 Tax=Pleuronectes platessa TaxID=8262 RepID=A0A9N7UMR6_PLEPL|nr:unnamed protein product [Pleuronectes platessa]